MLKHNNWSARTRDPMHGEEITILGLRDVLFEWIPILFEETASVQIDCVRRALCQWHYCCVVVRVRARLLRMRAV